MMWRNASPVLRRAMDTTAEMKAERERRERGRREIELAKRAMAMAELQAAWEEQERILRTTRPTVAALADRIRSFQPPWADGEECDVTARMVADELDELGLTVEEAK